ncbi:MAG: hypothetical protein QOH56_1811 [Pseudonocardiales bacterium]|jgi:hypothetical protein|nr:hypothetical protein [Pseudonocardiales bacterium]
MFWPEMATATVDNPVGVGPEIRAPVFESNVEPWHGQAKVGATVQPWCGQIALKPATALSLVRLMMISLPSAPLAATADPTGISDSLASTFWAAAPDELDADVLVAPAVGTAEDAPPAVVDAAETWAWFGEGAWLQAAKVRVVAPAAPTASTVLRLTPSD